VSKLTGTNVTIGRSLGGIKIQARETTFSREASIAMPQGYAARGKIELTRKTASETVVRATLVLDQPAERKQRLIQSLNRQSRKQGGSTTS
jgi:hypothetical protein